MFIYILSVVDDDFSKEDLLRDETIKRAIVRSIEIIGEASKKIPVDIKDKYNVINWKNMAGMRDRVIHNYMGINYTIVWDVVNHKIPELYTLMKKIIHKMEYRN